MSTPLSIALSPYHLATREPPAMVALLLADRVVTLVPEPASGASRAAVRAAAQNSPRYLRLMESWRWSSPLWNSGVICSGVDDEEASCELAGVYESIASDDALADLRVLTRGAQQRAAEDADKALDHIAGDMLRGGPDPGVNIPIAAALDRFANRHRMCVVRAGASSIAQRAETRLGTKIFSIAMPVLARAGGGRVQLLRNDLESDLARLRHAIDDAFAGAETAQSDANTRRIEAVADTAERYAAAYTRWAVDNARGDDENAERITSGYVSVTGMLMPPDAVLRASRAAIHALNGKPANGHGAPGPNHSPDAERLRVLIVREMSVRPEAA